jgi:hypothetical protein
MTLDVDHGDRRKMLGCLIGRLAGSLYLLDTGVGQEDHEGGGVVPVLPSGRYQVLALQIPAYAAEFLVGQPGVRQQPAAADMGYAASLGRSKIAFMTRRRSALCLAMSVTVLVSLP